MAVIHHALHCTLTRVQKRLGKDRATALKDDLDALGAGFVRELDPVIIRWGVARGMQNGSGRQGRPGEKRTKSASSNDTHRQTLPFRSLLRALPTPPAVASAHSDAAKPLGR